jgi:hypothetical protein
MDTTKVEPWVDVFTSDFVVPAPSGSGPYSAVRWRPRKQRKWKRWFRARLRDAWRSGQVVIWPWADKAVVSGFTKP